MTLYHLTFLAAVSAIQLRSTSDPILSSAGPEYQKATLPGPDFFHANYDKFPGTEDFAPQYERKMPVHFENKHLDDMFMNSMLTQYAKEGRNP